MDQQEVRHVHSPHCVGSNELDELCCGELAGDQLQASVRFEVTCRDPGASHAYVEHVFTDSPEDARAVATAAGHHVRRVVRSPRQPSWPS